KLPHSRIDKRESGLAHSPALEPLTGLVPERLQTRCIQTRRLYVLEPLVPGELGEPFLAPLRRRRGERGSGTVVDRDLPRRDQRREARRPVPARKVAVVDVT